MSLFNAINYMENLILFKNIRLHIYTKQSNATSISTTRSDRPRSKFTYTPYKANWIN